MVILTLLILGLKYCGKLPRYLCLPPWVNVIKLLIKVIYSHSMVFTAILMFYNTGWQQYHRMGVNYHGKKFYNIGPWWLKHRQQVKGHWFKSCQYNLVLKIAHSWRQFFYIVSKM
jgi:hypothetical protein